MFKRYIRKKLEGYTRRYFKKNPDVKLVAVAGSVGKTSTKLAIATVLAEKYRVRFHEGNYNSELSTPLAIFGLSYPQNRRSIVQWLAIFKTIRKTLKQPAEVDVVVQEFGMDRIGHIAEFGKYLNPDIGVVTAVAPEHMEFFGTLEAVAREELELTKFSKQSVINREDIDAKFAKFASRDNLSTYGTTEPAEYRFEPSDYSSRGAYGGRVFGPEFDKPFVAKINLVGEQSLKFAAAAVAVAAKLGLNKDEIKVGLAKIKPASGRMNILKGRKGAVILDDTYNSSPLAVEAALRTLYQMPAPQKIAVLGSMNELGDLSAKAHKKAGELCDPDELAWVVVVGEQAEKYLAPAAESKGCRVQVCRNAVEAGEFVAGVLESGAVVLFKGSEGGIFLEEAIKIILHATDDEEYLVRQSSEWLDRKARFFQSFSD